MLRVETESQRSGRKLRVSSAVRRGRRGLTLMELVVVLTVLAALSAIVVPLLPNLLRRSHLAQEAAQVTEVSKAIQLYQSVNLNYPGNWDLMTEQDGTAPGYLPTDGTAFKAAATVQQLGADEASALARVGITTGYHFADTPGHPTLNPYDDTTGQVTLSGTTQVFVIDNATTGEYPPEIANVLATDTSARFVVFGIGTRSDLVGKSIQTAPIIAPDSGNVTPAKFYSRPGAVFQVAGVGIDETAPDVSGNIVNGTKRARFVGCVILEDDEIESLEGAIVGFYNASESGQ